MRRPHRYAFVLVLLSALSLALAFQSSPSAAQQKPTTNPACVSACQQLLYNCFLENGTDDHHCISVYRSCMARCK